MIMAVVGCSHPQAYHLVTSTFSTLLSPTTLLDNNNCTCSYTHVGVQYTLGYYF